MKLSLSVVLVVMLAACQGQNTLIKSGNSYYHPGSNASIEITQELSVPAHSARAYFQNGKLLRHTGLNLYEVNCEVLINTVSESRQTISPGVFNIISISQNESPIVMRSSVQIAALDYSYTQYAKGGGGNGGGSPVEIKRDYRFKLAAQEPSTQITQVRSLTCRGVQDEPYNAKLPTFNEMQATVGPYIRFNLNLL